MAYFQFGNKQIHYDLYTGVLPEDVLFIHGNLASNRWWQPVLSELRNQYQEESSGGSVLLGEWLGCGKSTGIESVADLEMLSLAQDYIQLLKGTGLSEVHVVGHSTGALIALAIASLEPSMIKKMVLLDPVSVAGLQFGPEMYDAFTKMSEDRAFCEAVMTGTVYECDPQSQLMQQLVDDAFHVDKKVWHGVPDVLKRTDLRPLMSRIQHPTLVLHGDKDAVLPVEPAQQIAQMLQNGEFHLVKNHGHSLNVEDPALFVKLMSEFLFD